MLAALAARVLAHGRFASVAPLPLRRAALPAVLVAQVLRRVRAWFGFGFGFGLGLRLGLGLGKLGQLG